MRNEITQAEIQNAIRVIKDVGIADNAGKIPATFVGYVAAFGAAITLSGLLPAVILYSNEEAHTQDDRTKVVKAVTKLMEVDKKIKSDGKAYTLVEHLLGLSPEALPAVEEQVLHQAIVLKLALRTFRTQTDSNETANPDEA